LQLVLFEREALVGHGGLEVAIQARAGFLGINASADLIR
jgi:hypothetical protein